MRRFMILGLIALLSVVLTCGFAYAKVTGRCDNCHTMHNSQNGVKMADVDTPYAHLTKSSCLGCHGQGGTVVGGAPNIFGDATRTAGGTFKASVVDVVGGHKVHNVRDITWTNDEANLQNTTPGAESGGYTEPVGSAQLACAGYRGCHGKHDGSKNSDAGIRGFHHGAETGYRYLQFYDGATHTPTLGKGSSTWESGGATTANHNVYYALDAYTNDTNKDSISALCSLCHGEFHAGSDVYSSGNWIRHPTENKLSDASGWNMASVTVDVENNPFGFNGTDYTNANTGNMTGYTAANGRVTCISCHRAHGTSYDDLLRFDYATQNAGGGGTTGCLGCHHRQR